MPPPSSAGQGPSGWRERLGRRRVGQRGWTPTAPPRSGDAHPAPPFERWRRVAHHPAVFGDGDHSAVMASVCRVGSGLAAVGTHLGSAAVWTSTDARTWQRSHHDPAVFGSDDDMASMLAVSPFRSGLVAVGTHHGSAAVWTSTDAQTWQRTPDNPVVFGGDRAASESATMPDCMWAVRPFGPGLVAVGNHHNSAAVWTSTDAQTWQRSPHDTAVLGDSANLARMLDVISAGPGLVAVGSADGHAALWTSTDAQTWQRCLPDPADPKRGWITSVTAAPSRLVAVGDDGGGRWQAGVVWTSTDGMRWQRVTDEHRALFSEEVDMNAVTAGGPGFVAVGSDLGGSAAAVWLSADGTGWHRVTTNPLVFSDARMNAVMPWGPGLVAVGRDTDRGAAAVWIGH